MTSKRHHEHHESSVNTNGWMMSYADMATTLLAMFIVLSTLGKDQTGISLYNGTGSFVRALDAFGLPGVFSASKKVIQLDTAGPHYLGGMETEDAAGHLWSREPSEDELRVLDIEEEHLQQFLQEMQRQLPLAKWPRTQGQAAVDFYDPLNRQPPLLAARHQEVAWQVVPLLRRSNYRVFVVVWATMPSPRAWMRAANQAQALVEEIANAAELDQAARTRLVPLGQPWPYRNRRRPVFSLVIRKLDEAS
ncbi:MAG TPA: flagellar motor protein MotB [Gemmataceae bacterium]|nr:flagellar motor protein MotB [Gemmataceae bacterium]